MSSPRPIGDDWDHGSHGEFYDYYEKASRSQRTLSRFRSVRDNILRMHPTLASGQPCEVADIGCGAGTQSLLWAELGCKVRGIDVNEPLLDLARRRSEEKGYPVEFVLGTAVSLPWPDESFHVCLAVELLEHVTDWRSCLMEFSRVVRPGGVLFLSTSNALCPIQAEFNLPLYSWYPSRLKRYCERLANTSHPALANYAKYPAVNWFTFYQLREFLRVRGFDSLDRFDLIDVAKKGVVAKSILSLVTTFRFARWIAHVATPGTTVLAIKRKSSDKDGRS